MRSIIFILIFSILMSLSGNMYGDNTRVSTRGAGIVMMALEPRPMSMGGAFTAVSDDIHALVYNPAGIGLIRDLLGSISYQKGIEDMHYGSASLVYPIGRQSALGLNFGFFHQGFFDLYHQEGTIERGSLGNSYKLGLTYGILFKDSDISLGATLKMINSTLYTYSASTGAVDLGLLYHPLSADSKKNRFSFGIAVLNLGPGLKYIEEEDPLPTAYKLGIAYACHFKAGKTPFRLLFANDIIKDDQYEGLGVNTGIEFKYRDILMVRAGYQFRGGLDLDDDNGFNTGMGINYSDLQFDYSFKLSSSELNSTSHCFSVSYRFSSSGERRNKKSSLSLKRSLGEEPEVEEKKVEDKVKTIKYSDIPLYNKIILGVSKGPSNSGNNYKIQYSTKETPDQSPDSEDYKGNVFDETRVKWVRWVEKNKNTNKPVYYKISIE
ncbi:MAG: PorV/PorQ family protein [Spirochaetes bacterium]|nr:PorV/PorQ family protein [Spirochaetota bacterium]